jgi:hypothetical protein
MRTGSTVPALSSAALIHESRQGVLISTLAKLYALSLFAPHRKFI